jgi:hypothetical protein
LQKSVSNVLGWAVRLVKIGSMMMTKREQLEYELWLDSIQLPPDYQEAIDQPLTLEEKNQVKIDQIFPPF